MKKPVNDGFEPLGETDDEESMFDDDRETRGPVVISNPGVPPDRIPDAEVQPAPPPSPPGS